MTAIRCIEPDWELWNPGLDNGAATLGSVYETLPGDGPGDIDQIVRLLENPTSPYALPGAVSLRHHDCIHILLGRGLLNQDEAFVIGFTMGTAGAAISHEKVQLFRLATKHLYRPPYRFSDDDLVAYDLGFECARNAAAPNLASVDFDALWLRKLGTLRRELGIDTAALCAAYRTERRRLPGTRVSRRLPH